MTWPPSSPPRSASSSPPSTGRSSSSCARTSPPRARRPPPGGCRPSAALRPRTSSHSSPRSRPRRWPTSPACPSPAAASDHVAGTREDTAMSTPIVPNFDDEAGSGRKLAIICSKGNLDMAYPGLILANAALGEGVETHLFFTFWGFDMIAKKRMNELKFSPTGNTAMHMPVGDLLLQHLGRNGLHAGHRGERLRHADVADRHVHRGVAGGAVLQLVHPLLGDHAAAPEREEQVRLHALAERGVGQDQAGVGHVQVALGADDGELAPAAGLVVEVGDDGCAHSGVLSGAGDVVRRSRGAWAGRRCRPSSWPASWGRVRTGPWSQSRRRSAPAGWWPSRPGWRSPCAGTRGPSSARR